MFEIKFLFLFFDCSEIYKCFIHKNNIDKEWFPSFVNHLCNDLIIIKPHNLCPKILSL